METKQFVAALNDDAIAKAIGVAEKRTSGEVRVFVTETEVENPVGEAEKQFQRLGMTKTELRNAVLIYFAPKSQAFAVIGDEGIHKKCGQDLWEGVTQQMTPLLKEGKYTEAVIAGVEQLGNALAREFPWRKGDRNELPNTVERDDSKGEKKQ